MKLCAITGVWDFQCHVPGIFKQFVESFSNATGVVGMEKFTNEMIFLHFIYLEEHV